MIALTTPPYVLATIILCVIRLHKPHVQLVVFNQEQSAIAVLWNICSEDTFPLGIIKYNRRGKYYRRLLKIFRFCFFLGNFHACAADHGLFLFYPLVKFSSELGQHRHSDVMLKFRQRHGNLSNWTTYQALKFRRGTWITPLTGPFISTSCHVHMHVDSFFACFHCMRFHSCLWKSIFFSR